MTGLQWAAGAGTPWWLVVVFGLVGAGLGTLTGRGAGHRSTTGSSRTRPPRRRRGTGGGRAWPCGASWAFLAWRIGDGAGWAALPAYLLFAWLAVGLLWIDADVHRLPDGLVLPAYPALLVMLVVATAGLGEWAALVRALACMAALYAVYFLMAVTSPSSLGFGDVKLAGGDRSACSAGWGWEPPSSGCSRGSSWEAWSRWSCSSGRGRGCARTSPTDPRCCVGAFVALAVEFQWVA